MKNEAQVVVARKKRKEEMRENIQKKKKNTKSMFRCIQKINQCSQSSLLSFTILNGKDWHGRNRFARSFVTFIVQTIWHLLKFSLYLQITLCAPARDLGPHGFPST